MFSTTRHVSLNTDPGFRYFSDGPLISARASADEIAILKLEKVCKAFFLN
jgi:hypothetical protein